MCRFIFPPDCLFSAYIVESYTFCTLHFIRYKFTIKERKREKERTEFTCTNIQLLTLCMYSISFRTYCALKTKETTEIKWKRWSDVGQRSIFISNELRTLEVIEIMELFMSRNHHHQCTAYTVWGLRGERLINQIFSCIRYVFGSFDRRASSIINIVIYSLRARSRNYQECAWKMRQAEAQREGEGNILRNRANVVCIQHIHKKHINSIIACVYHALMN